MSNSTAAATPPPGTIWVAEIGPALNFLMIGATMGATLVSMLIALFFFSTPALRKKPVFILNVLALLLGIAAAITNVYEEFRTLLFPQVPLDPHVIIAMGAFDGVTPTLVDTILLVRIVAVYPYRTTPRIKFLFILGVPIMVKIARIINAGIFLADYAHTIHASTGIGGAAILITSRLPSIKLEWSLQLFDDIYSSAIFLSRVYRQSTFKESRTISQTVKTLFWISTTNFVFPLMLGITQLAIYLARPDDYLIALYVEEVNFHFTIIGVVFATLWVAEGRWAESNRIPTHSISTSSSPPTSSPRYLKEGITFSRPPVVDITISQNTYIYPPDTSQDLESEHELQEIDTRPSEYKLVERPVHVTAA